jgi:hypothetical protein
MALPTYRTNRVSRSRRSADHVAFQAFFERGALREKRRRSRRLTLIVSLSVHAVAIVALIVYSLWRVDELWTTSVQVKVYSRKAAPPEALTPMRAPSPTPHPY